MLVLNGKTALRDGFRVLCESSASAPDKDYMEVSDLKLVPNGARIIFIMRDSYTFEATHLNLSPESARRFAETLLAFLDTLDKQV